MNTQPTPKDYSNLTKAQLIELIHGMENSKQYGLVWDAERVPEKVVEDCKFMLPVLKEVATKRIQTSDEDLTHILIEGDNYHALSTLNYTHAKKIDLIYIDPPYNTGKANEWKYNDKFVDKTDNYYHSKWLQMMSTRLIAAFNLLTENGIILISIDDHELANLKLLSNKIFGESNWLETFIWNTEGNIDNQKKIKSKHEYILAFAKNEKLFKAPTVIDPNISQDSKLYNDTIENSITKNGSKNPTSKVIAPIGFPCLEKEGLIKATDKSWPKIHNEINIFNYETTNETVFESGWSSKSLLEQFIKNQFEPIIDSKGQKTWFKITKTGAIYVYKSRSSDQSHVLSVLSNFGTTKKNSEELKRMGIAFNFPKPVDLVKYILQLHNNKNATIVDFFAGSGTTGHAVLNLNKEDGGKRQFILCTNNENKIAEEITYKRILKVVEGYGANQGIPANVRYYKTDFVKKTSNKGQVRMDVTWSCTEMLCVKEGIYELYKESFDWKIFKHNDKIMAIYYDFATANLSEIKEELEQLEGQKTLYQFCQNPLGFNEKEVLSWEDLGIKLKTIPQKILDIYNQLYK